MADLTAKILVIDDEKNVCTSCKRILEEEGHVVEYVLTGEEGLRRAVEGNYEIVLLDLKIPDLDGGEVLDRIHQKRSDVTVIIITGYATIRTSIECVKKGAFDYIPKPFTPEELALAVSKALSHHRLRNENEFLKSELNRVQGRSRALIGRSDAIQEIDKQLLKIAPTDFTIHIYGESGTGKEVIAQAIHANSLRKEKQFVAVDLSSLSSTLVESELFGHVKGAFTGATQNRPGYFTLAHGGTLFLDEVSNVSLELQGKLLRVIESRRVRPVGGDHDHEVNIRLISATNRDLAQMVEEGKFREDLFYRINVIPIHVPPLRARPVDIPLFAIHFLEEATRSSQRPVKGFTTEAMAKLVGYGWPGNIRELKTVVERLVATTERELIGIEQLPPEIAQPAGALPTGVKEIPRTVEELKEAKRQMRDYVYEQVEREFVTQALSAASGNVTKAATATGMQRTNFHALMRKYGVRGGERS
jgi:DNA-binding NtrC family response regulator